MDRFHMRAVVLIPALALLTAMLATPASAAAVRCFGERATIVGTAGADVLVGTNRGDVIAGRGGSDTIRGRGRNDLICGGRGDDAIAGGTGIDALFGEAGDDDLVGGGGPWDVIIPGAGNDTADATGGSPSNADELLYLDSPRGVVIDAAAGTATGFGNDTFTGFEWYIGSDHDDTITGTDADAFEILFGAGGNDTLDGRGDDNGLAGGPGDDVLTGGPGFDILLEHFMAEYYRQPLPEGPFVVNLMTQTFTGLGDDTISGIEGATGTQADDVMTGDAGDNEFTGLLGGADTVDAGAGDDTVDGGEGVDDLDGGPGSDFLGFRDYPTGITADLSTSTVSDGDAIASFENLIGSFFDDVLTGDAGPNEIEGGAGSDELSGLAGDDELWGDFFGFTEGNSEPDTADGGEGTDICDAETETACESDPAPPDAAKAARATYRALR